MNCILSKQKERRKFPLMMVVVVMVIMRVMVFTVMMEVGPLGDDYVRKADPS